MGLKKGYFLSLRHKNVFFPVSFFNRTSKACIAASQMNWAHLPSDILFLIADALPVDDAVHLSLTCTAWKRILESERFWCFQYSKATGIPREQLRLVNSLTEK